MNTTSKTMLGVRPVVYEHEIERAVQRQLEIERKAAAWDSLAMHLSEQGNTDGKKLLDWMLQLQQGLRHA